MSSSIFTHQKFDITIDFIRDIPGSASCKLYKTFGGNNNNNNNDNNNNNNNNNSFVLSNNEQLNQHKIKRLHINKYIKPSYLGTDQYRVQTEKFH